nr:MAG TPA: hypothetical protein [Caudoviricetes sp.]
MLTYKDTALPADTPVVLTALVKSAFVITLLSSTYAVPLSWIPRVCVFAGERRDVLYVDCTMTSPKLLFTI